MPARTMIYMLLSATALASSAAWGQAAPDASPAVASEGDAIDEIIVTAQKRAERLVNVPITITAVTGDRLQSAGVDSLSGLIQVVPAFRIDNNGPQKQPSIRGVGSSSGGPGSGSAVGIYVDGFFVPSAYSTDFDLLNVRNIQVVKGPQGTLFGRNTTAGAVLVTSSDPSTKTSAMGKLSYARFNSLDAAFYGTTGLTDRLAVDLAVLYRSGDGFMRNIVTGSHKDGQYKNVTARGGIKLELNDTDSIMLRYSHQKSDDPTQAKMGVYKGLSMASVLDPTSPVATKRGEVGSDQFEAFRSNVDTVALTGRFDLGFANLTSYSMYRDEHDVLFTDIGASKMDTFYANQLTSDETITQELNLNSKPGGPLDWVAGLFYLREKGGIPVFLIAPFGADFFPLWSAGNKVTSYAAFVDATYNVAPGLFLTAGARYSHERNNAFYDLAVPDATTGQPVGLYPFKHSWNSFTPRAVVRYEIDEASNVYGSVTKGFKAGLLNPAGLSTTPVDPENILAFEVGYKLSRGATRFNISAFHYSYDGLQVATYSGTQLIITNAAKSKVYGAEFDFATKIGERLGLSLGAAYTRAKYVKYETAPRFDQVLDPTSPAYGLFVSSSMDVSGNQMQRAPKFSANVGVDYTAQVAGGKLILNGNYSYQSKVAFDPARQFVQGGYGLLNLRATWTEPSNHWSFSVFGNNVTDETYTQGVFASPFAIRQTYGQPAVYGGSVSFRY